LKEGEAMANTTLGEAQIQAMQHINEYSTGGVNISTTDGNYIDLIKRMPPLANTAQQELSKIVKIPGKYSISQNPITNLLGLRGFDEVQHFPGTDLSYSGTGAKSFSIEVDGACSIYFYETIAGVLTALNGTYSKDGGISTAFTGSIAVTGLTSFSNYKGLLTISSATNLITMKVVATYPMKSKGRALFEYTFATALTAPYLIAYVPYSLPTDYVEFYKMLRAFDQRQYTENKDYILTPDKKIHLNYNLTGQFDIHYWKKPTMITNSTATTYEFEVSEDAQALIPWFIGGYAIMDEKPNVGMPLINQYQVLKASLSPMQTSSEETIMDTFNW
jgi:hypothetical protein